MARTGRAITAASLLVALAACRITAHSPHLSDGQGALEAERISRLLAGNEWGQVLHCRIEDGRARFFDGFQAFTVQDFSIVVGERQVVYLSATGAGNQQQLYLSFRSDGGFLTACRDRFRDHGASCDLFETRIDRHEPAIAEPLDVPHFIEGARLTCRWPPPNQRR